MKIDLNYMNINLDSSRDIKNYRFDNLMVMMVFNWKEELKNEVKSLHNNAPSKFRGPWVEKGFF